MSTRSDINWAQVGCEARERLQGQPPSDEATLRRLAKEYGLPDYVLQKALDGQAAE
jgi:hypothetical protein